jgi:hypothetical protein
MVESIRCASCRKAFASEAAHDAHMPECTGPDVNGGQSATHRIVLPAGQGVYCWACGRFRRTLWLPPDFCCATCKAVLLTASELN